MASEKKETIYETAISDGSVASLGEIGATHAEITFMEKILGHEASESELEDKNFQIPLRGAIEMSSAEARQIVSKAIVEHANDRNFPQELRDYFHDAVEGDETELIEDGVTRDYLLRTCAAVMKFSSPYPDVRANTTNYDDPEEYCETIRAYIVGIVWVGIGSFVNQFFTVRLPSISLSMVLLQLFSVPSGVLLAKILPDWGFTFRGTRHTLNPGPWSYKEQSLVTIMLGITSSLAYVDSQILVQKLDVFYGNEWASQGYQICMLLSTQYLGFGIAGIFRSLLVYPSQNLWMNNFPNLAFNKAFLTPDDRRPVNGWTLTRWHFFGIVFVAIFIYEWLPLYLMSFLAYFSWMCWAAPNNFNVNTITGSQTGLGFNPIPTFDWSTIGSASLYTPFFSYCNIMVGAVTGGLIIIAVYYSNMYYSAYLPINSNHLFTNQGLPYKVTEILTDNVLDEAKYQAYSPPYYSAANLVLYGAFFAAYTCLYVTSLLYDYEVMWDSCKELVLGAIGKGKSVKDYDDAHSRMMSKYKETPQWWFIVVLLVSLALAIVTIKAFPTETPVWGLFMSLGLSVIFLIPIGVLYSRTNNLMSINVLTELLIGYAKPGHGTAMMLVKAYGVNTNFQAISFLNDLKYGHYAKIPPRASFRVQTIATLVSGFIVFGVCQFQLTIEGICTNALRKTTKFTCPGENTYFSASVLWGVIGPKRVFDSQYPVLKWCFLIGCFIPIPLFLVRFFFPKSRRLLRNVEPNSMISGLLSYFAPTNLTYATGGFYVNIAFMYYVRRRYTRWFEKYNYVLAAALSAGTALSAFIIFWAVQYHPKDIDWWGNVGFADNIDGNGDLTLLTLDLDADPSAHFGPGPGEYYY